MTIQKSPKVYLVIQIHRKDGSIETIKVPVKAVKSNG